MPGRQVFHPAVADVGRSTSNDFAARGRGGGFFLELLGEPGPAITLERHFIAARSSLLQLLDELQAVDMSTSVT